jgi:hypothetical protein
MIMRQGDFILGFISFLSSSSCIHTSATHLTTYITLLHDHLHHLTYLP